MDMNEIISRAVEHVPEKPYMGNEDQPLAARITLEMLRDLDHVAAFVGVSRSEMLRSILADALPRALALCEKHGANAKGQTFDSLRPKYFEDLSHREQDEIRDYEASR